MIDSLKLVLEDFFSIYDDYHPLILFIFSIALMIISWRQKVLLQKLGSQLKRSEIVFSNHYNYQIETIKKVYELVTNMNYANMNIFQSRDIYKRHDNLKSNIKHWSEAFIELHFYFNRNKIIFPENLSFLLETEIDELNKARHILLDHKISMEEFEDKYGFDFNLMYSNYGNEVTEISNQIEVLKKEEKIQMSINRIENIKEQLRKEYKKLINGNEKKKMSIDRLKTIKAKFWKKSKPN